MIYKLKPLDFEGNRYGLGDVIEINYVIDPHTNVDLRELRIELDCIQQYVDRQAGDGTTGGTNPMSGMTNATTGPPKQFTQRFETYSHSQASVLQASKLQENVPISGQIILRIDEALPRRAEDVKSLEQNANRSWFFK